MSFSPRQAISTKFIGPTNTRGSRIKASAQAGSMTFPYDHSLSASMNHAAAAKKFADKYEWNGVWVGGGGVNRNGDMVFVKVDESATLVF